MFSFLIFLFFIHLDIVSPAKTLHLIIRKREEKQEDDFKKIFLCIYLNILFHYSINPKILISSLRYLTGSYSHFNIYIANFTMYSLKCHTEDVRGVREDIGRKERIKKRVDSIYSQSIKYFLFTIPIFCRTIPTL